MAQISRLPLPKYLEEQTRTLFHRALADLRSEDDVADFLDDLLTPTERVMLGKRLAIAVLLAKGYDQRTIHRIMKVSLATVNSVNYWVKNRGTGYKKVITKVLKEQQWSDFLNKLEENIKEFYHSAHTVSPWVPKEQSSHSRLV